MAHSDAAGSASTARAIEAARPLRRVAGRSRGFYGEPRVGDGDSAAVSRADVIAWTPRLAGNLAGPGGCLMLPPEPAVCVQRHFGGHREDRCTSVVVRRGREGSRATIRCDKAALASADRDLDALGQRGVHFLTRHGGFRPAASLFHAAMTARAAYRRNTPGISCGTGVVRPRRT